MGGMKLPSKNNEVCFICNNTLNRVANTIQKKGIMCLCCECFRIVTLGRLNCGTESIDIDMCTSCVAFGQCGTGKSLEIIISLGLLKLSPEQRKKARRLSDIYTSNFYQEKESELFFRRAAEQARRGERFW